MSKDFKEVHFLASDDNPSLVTFEQNINLSFSSLGKPSARAVKPESDIQSESKSLWSEAEPCLSFT